jgi:heat shock protein HslJ
VRVIAILAITMSVAGCSSDAPSASPGGDVAGLSGTSWIVVTVSGRSPVAGAVPTLTFADESIQAFFGCNQGGGAYRLDPSTGQFAVQDVATTDMACLRAGVSEFETAFVQALTSARRASLDPTSGQLHLDGPGGGIVLVRLEHPASS